MARLLAVARLMARLLAVARLMAWLLAVARLLVRLLVVDRTSRASSTTEHWPSRLHRSPVTLNSR